MSEPKNLEATSYITQEQAKDRLLEALLRTCEAVYLDGTGYVYSYESVIAVGAALRRVVRESIAMKVSVEGAATFSHGCPMGCDSPWADRCKCDGKCHIHQVER